VFQLFTVERWTTPAAVVHGVPSAISRISIAYQLEGFSSNATLFKELNSKYFLLKIVVQPKHVADNLNKIVKKLFK
jgi:hypothetical protein